MATFRTIFVTFRSMIVHHMIATKMAVHFRNGKLVLLSIVTISSATIFYWLFWRKKRSHPVRGLKDDVVISKDRARSWPREENCLSERAIKVLVHRLRDDYDVENMKELENILLTLLKTTAFTSHQVYFLECDGIAAIANKLQVRDERIKELALQIINNMALHQDSPKLIKNYIPQLVQIIEHESDGLIVKSLQVLTNLSVLEEYHKEILSGMNRTWPKLLYCAYFQVKIQTLKLLVNLSSNPSSVDILSNSELLGPVNSFVKPNVPHELCLRSVTYLANILQAIQRLGKTSLKCFIVSIPGLQDNIRLLSRSEQVDICFQANRALTVIS